MGTTLRARIEAEIEAGGGTLNSLTVLDAGRDPYRIDTPAGHRTAAWFAAQIERLLSSTATVHLRGLHYILVTREVIKPNGKPYRNVDADYEWLVSNAARSARFLGYVEFERIVDERNAEPIIFVNTTTPGVPRVELLNGTPFNPPLGGLEIAIPDLDFALPAYLVRHDFGAGAAEPHRACRRKDKPAAGPAADGRPDCRRVLLPTGEMSDTMLYGMMTRAAEDGRPTKVLYFSDFDPSGYWMPPRSAGKYRRCAIRAGPTST